MDDNFLDELKALAAALGWRGKFSGTLHPRLKIAVPYDPDAEGELAKSVVRAIAEKHGPGWFRTIASVPVCYLGDTIGERTSLGTYYVHQNVTEET